MATTSRSKSPQVLGFVSMMAATSGAEPLFHVLGIDRAVLARRHRFDLKPMRAAVAGLVPWAESGTSTTCGSPLALGLEGRLDGHHAASSPWAPAFGEGARRSCGQLAR